MNILLVRLRLIGDVVFTTPSIRALRRHLPDARLSYLVEREAAPVVARNPHLNEVICSERAPAGGGLRADVRLALALRRRRFHVAIDFHGGPRAAWLTRLSGASRRIGYDIPGRRWLYTDLVPRAHGLRPRHSVENQWDLLVPLGIGPPSRRNDRTEMVEDAAAAAAVLDRLAARGVEPLRDRVIVVHVSAGNPFRRWPEAHFVELVTELVSCDPGRRVVLTSGPSDESATRRIGTAARRALGARGHAPGAVIDDLEVGLAELHALMRRAVLFIGGDSGPLHVAGTTDVPIVGIYGPTLPARSAPWRCESLVAEAVELTDLACRPCDQRRCEPGDFRCLGRIGPSRVVEAAERAMETARIDSHRREPAKKDGTP